MWWLLCSICDADDLYNLWENELFLLLAVLTFRHGIESMLLTPKGAEYKYLIHHRRRQLL